MGKTKNNVFFKNKNEILYNLISAGIAGSITLLGAISDGNLTSRGIATAITIGLSVAIIKFRDYWITQEKEYQSKINKAVTFI